MHAHAMVVVSGARTLIVSGAQLLASPMMTFISKLLVVNVMSY